MWSSSVLLRLGLTTTARECTMIDHWLSIGRLITSVYAKPIATGSEASLVSGKQKTITSIGLAAAAPWRGLMQLQILRTQFEVIL